MADLQHRRISRLRGTFLFCYNKLGRRSGMDKRSGLLTRLSRSRTGRKGPYAAYYLQIAPGQSFIGEFLLFVMRLWTLCGRTEREGCTKTTSLPAWDAIRGRRRRQTSDLTQTCASSAAVMILQGHIIDLSDLHHAHHHIQWLLVARARESGSEV